MFAILPFLAAASTGQHKYTLGRIHDRTHANWEKRITTAPLEAPIKSYNAQASVWHDQGWGNQKSQVRLALYDRNGAYKGADSLFGVAPHKDQPGGVMGATLPALKKLSEPGDTLSVETYVGGGGGHQLFLDGFQLTVRQAVTELKSYKIAAIDDRSHDNWEIKLETSKLKGKLTGYTATAEKFHDQGWGNQKSRVRMTLRDSQGKIKYSDDLFGIAPHRDPAGALLVENDYKIVDLSQPGDYLTVETYVGGGGGHSLHMKDFELIVRQSEATTRVRNPKSQCYDDMIGAKAGDRRDNPIFGSGGFIGVMTLDKCMEACEARKDAHGRPCVAVEWSDGGADLPANAARNCALAWSCDYVMPWSGGSVIYKGRRRAEDDEDILEVTVEELEFEDDFVDELADELLIPEDLGEGPF